MICALPKNLSNICTFILKLCFEINLFKRNMNFCILIETKYLFLQLESIEALEDRKKDCSDILKFVFVIDKYYCKQYII